MTEQGSDSGESEVIAEMTPEQLQKAIADAQPMRKFAIETDGNGIRVVVNELTGLEVRAMCLMLLQKLGG